MPSAIRNGTGPAAGGENEVNLSPGEKKKSPCEEHANAFSFFCFKK